MKINIKNSHNLKSNKLLSKIKNKKIISYLMDSGSLTARLKQKYDNDFYVKVLKNKKSKIFKNEKKILTKNSNKIAFVREVLLYGNNQPVVFARTTIPKKSLKSPLFKLTKIGAKPLGEILFKQKTAKRAKIQIIKIKQKNNKILWGRISLFYLYHQPFLLTEIFLPNLFNKDNKKRSNEKC